MLVRVGFIMCANSFVIHESRTEKVATPAICIANALLCMHARTCNSVLVSACGNAAVLVTRMVPSMRRATGSFLSARISDSREVHADSGIGVKHCSSACATTLSTSACEGSSNESMVSPGRSFLSLRSLSTRSGMDNLRGSWDVRPS